MADKVTRNEVVDVLTKFTRCPRFGHRDEGGRRRRIDCYDDQCTNPEHVKYEDCDHASHDAVELVNRILSEPCDGFVRFEFTDDGAMAQTWHSAHDSGPCDLDKEAI